MYVFDVAVNIERLAFKRVCADVIYSFKLDSRKHECARINWKVPGDSYVPRNYAFCANLVASLLCLRDRNNFPLTDLTVLQSAWRYTVFLGRDDDENDFSYFPHTFSHFVALINASRRHVIRRSDDF